MNKKKAIKTAWDALPDKKKKEIAKLKGKDRDMIIEILCAALPPTMTCNIVCVSHSFLWSILSVLIDDFLEE